LRRASDKIGQFKELVIDTTAIAATSAIMQRILFWRDNAVIALLAVHQLGACKMSAHLL
jgi:hypothetical protein